jgi:hypothetical protein
MMLQPQSRPHLVGPKVRVLVLLINSRFLHANFMQDPPPKFGLSRMSYPCRSLEMVWVTFSRRSDWDCCCSLLWKQTEEITYPSSRFKLIAFIYLALVCFEWKYIDYRANIYYKYYIAHKREKNKFLSRWAILKWPNSVASKIRWKMPAFLFKFNTFFLN